MKPITLSLDRFEDVTAGYSALRVAVLGDFCLDRYLEIDPGRAEVSIETGLPVHNVVRVRAQPGAAGTILNNLVALGVGTLYPIGFCGLDGEGFELRRALEQMPGVRLNGFVTSEERRTFTYCKPLVVAQGQAPRELSRLDTKNWTPTPASVESRMINNLEMLADQLDALIVLDQVDQPGTGVVTDGVLSAVGKLGERRPDLWILADSRRGLARFPRVCFKMNRNELAMLVGRDSQGGLAEVEQWARDLARRQGKPVFVTLSEAGMLGARPEGEVVRVPTWPVRGEIDIVGAGDAVTANLLTALAAGAELREALELANAAASIVIHQLGTTGTATVRQLHELLFGARLRVGDGTGSVAAN
jgi:rfaE bifunctional protein kinase chain/domain